MKARSAPATIADVLTEKVRTGTARVAVIGLGYVGLPLAVEFAKHFPTIGIDIDNDRVAAINAGKSYIADLSDADIEPLVKRGMLTSSTSFSVLADVDCICICVPTPLEAGKQPDVSFVISAADAIADQLRPGQLIVLESTTYPGTTRELLLEKFTKNGLRLDEDFLLAFSPERIDPGNSTFKIADIPKIVGGCSHLSGEVSAALYRTIVPSVHIVSSTRSQKLPNSGRTRFVRSTLHSPTRCRFCVTTSASIHPK